MEPKITWKQVSPAEGLALMGQGQRGTVMVSQGLIKVKRYAFRRRANGEIHVRWGILRSATATFIDGAFSHVVFER